MEVTGLIDICQRSIDQMSAGAKKQRAWIAMALAQQTDIFCWMNPLTFLDMAQQFGSIDRILRPIKQKEQRTIVMAVHDLNSRCSPDMPKRLCHQERENVEKVHQRKWSTKNVYERSFWCEADIYTRRKDWRSCLYPLSSFERGNKCESDVIDL